MSNALRGVNDMTERMKVSLEREQFLPHPEILTIVALSQDVGDLVRDINLTKRQLQEFENYASQYIIWLDSVNATFDISPDEE